MTETAMTEQIALITGGSRGLGRSIALHLAAEGVGVAITYLSREDEAAAVVAEAQALGVGAVALQLDTGDTTAFDDFVARFSTALDETWGRSDFDHLVNNAGIGIHSPFLDTTEEQFDQLLNIHLKGVFFLTQRLVPLMVDGGRIVNMSTGLARFSMPGYSVYGAAKGAVEVLTRYLAAELGGRDISVNAVAPGAIETDFGGGVVRDVQALNDQIASITAMGRVGLPDDVGGAVASLLTGGNQWITAQRIEISGGMNL